jgi:hypothetical protein
MGRFVAAALLISLLAVVACEGVPGGGGGGTGGAARPSPPSVDLKVGPLEDGSTINLGIGKTLGVEVANAQTTNASVLQPAGSLPSHPEYRVFRGLLPGEAEITGQIRPDCPRNAACPAWIREFRIGVVVGRSTPTSKQAQITESNEQTIYTMKVGEAVDVALRPLPGYTEWQNLASSDQRVLVRVTNPAVDRVNGMAVGRFQAVAPGTTQITANSGVACTPGMSCIQLARLFTVTVRVIG